jgi:hypothetical protein
LDGADRDIFFQNLFSPPDILQLRSPATRNHKSLVNHT